MQPKFDAEQYFSNGGRAVVGHTSAAGVPVSLEEHKGEIRHRKDSGTSRMAADYGYIDNSKPDHDGMKTDAFVGPHKDSDKVFVVNQQHPRTGKFNEHKVLLGYKDRAHALRDYAHSFSDGLGHKRIHSVVEMGKHELQDWLKKDHSKPLEKAIGGQVTNPNDPNQWLKFGGQDMETAPSGLPIGQAVGTDVAYQMAEGLADAAKLAQEVQAGEVDPTSDEGIQRALGAAMVAQTGGVGGAPAGGAVLGSGMVRRAAEGAAERELSPLGLYSQAAEVAQNLPQAKGSPQQMKAMLKGVKQEELAGFDEAFAGKPSVTREEIAAHFKERMPVVEETVLKGRSNSEIEDALSIAESRGDYDTFDRLLAEQEASTKLKGKPTKFEQYTLPGGENYREVLLKTPASWEPKIQEKYGRFGFEGPDGTYKDYWTKSDAEQAARSFRRDSGDFKSQHWDDPNVLAHLRMSDRTGPNGEKILHVEEIQSDWGQKGKKEGFADPAAKEKLGDLSSKYDELGKERRAAEKEMADLPDYNDRFAALQDRVAQIGQERDMLSDQMATLRSSVEGKTIPTAPYVTNTQAWTDLALKRALKEAAEGGYDKLVWTPGAEQAKRYSLSNHVHELHYSPEEGKLYGTQTNGGRFEQSASPDKLSGLIGKETSKKLLAQPLNKSGYWAGHQTLSNQDLVLGGEGMKGYYDKIVPKRLQEIIKKHDPEAKVGYTDVLLPPKKGVGHNNPPFEAPGITITPKMRESLLKGQTAYAEGGEVDAPKPDLPEQVSNVAHDLAHIAHRDKLDQRHLAYLLKVASGMYMPPERAMDFARQIMTGDVDGLLQRFQTYAPSARTFARLNEMMGGKHDFMGSGHMGDQMARMKGLDGLQRTKEHVEGALDSDVVKSRPAMAKALKRLSKRI